MKHQITAEHVPTPEAAPKPVNDTSINRGLMELLAKWREEDATDDPELLRIAKHELSEFKRAMNKNRVEAGEIPLFP